MVIEGVDCKIILLSLGFLVSDGGVGWRQSWKS